MDLSLLLFVDKKTFLCNAHMCSGFLFHSIWTFRFRFFFFLSLFAFKQCHVLKIKSVTQFWIEANDDSREQFNVSKSSVSSAQKGTHVGNWKRLVNCNDCRFIFNIINIYTLRIVLSAFFGRIRIFCFFFFFWWFFLWTSSYWGDG